MDWLTVARLRYRTFLAERGRSVAIALLVAGVALSGVALAAVASPPTETVSQPTDTVVVTASETTTATVSGETDMYDRGEVVRESPVYLTDAAPTFSVTARVGTAEDRRLEVDQRLTLVYEAIDGEERFWQRRETVARSSETTAGNASVTATLNASEILAQQRALDAETGGRVTVRAALVHTASYSVGDHEGEFANDAEIDVSGRTYSIGDGIADKATYLERAQVTRPIETKVYDPSVLGTTRSVPKRGVHAGLAAVACWIAGAHAAVLTRRGLDAVAIERDLTRLRFDGWISRARVPDELGDRRVSVASLGDLVDVAIDVDSRVVYDSTRELYVVLADNATYVYAPSDGAIGEMADARPDRALDGTALDPPVEGQAPDDALDGSKPRARDRTDEDAESDADEFDWNEPAGLEADAES